MEAIGKSTWRINNTCYECYIGSQSMQSQGALDIVSVIWLMHDARRLN